jgi:hypothetical protein
MPTFLSDPTLGFYLILSMVVPITGMIWYRLRTKKTLALFGIAALLLLVLFACDRFTESPREEAVRKVRAMATTANARQWNDTFSHFSDKFQYNGMNKAKFQAFVTPLATQHNATVNFKDFDRDNHEERAPDRLVIGFVAQLTAPGADLVPFYIEAEFAKDPDGQFRMTGFKVYDYITRKKGGEQKMPGL